MSTFMIDIKPKALKRWKALVEYRKTCDILQLQRTLRHKNVRTTVAYLDRSSPLIKLLGKSENAEEI